MKIVTSEAFKKIGDYCTKQLEIPKLILTENSAFKIFSNLEVEKYNSFIIVCGYGNNGSDGLALARHIFIKGKKVEVFLVGNSEMTVDYRTNYNILKKFGVPINKLSNVEDVSDFREIVINGDVIVDAILGTGISRDVTGIYTQVISIINENSKYTISLDIPSGMNCNTGRVMGNCVKATKTISLQAYKIGFLNYASEEYTGEVIVENIGIPDNIVTKFYDGESIMNLETIKKLLIPRKKYSHKGDYGNIVLVAGSKDFIGAAYISTMSSVKSGGGLVTLCCRDEIQGILSSKLTEAMTVSIKSERFEQVLEKGDVIAFGPGMGNNEETFKILKDTLEKATCPILIDADGLNVLENNLSLLKKYKNKLVFTPHLGEMSRLANLSIKYIEQNRLEVAKKFAEKFNLVLVLKGYNTIITDGETTIINPTGNSSMATGGMGDCLTGIIAAFIGQGYEPFVAAYLGVYIHGLCGDILSQELFSVNAESVINKIPFILKDIENYKSN